MAWYEHPWVHSDIKTRVRNYQELEAKMTLKVDPNISNGKKGNWSSPVGRPGQWWACWSVAGPETHWWGLWRPRSVLQVLRPPQTLHAKRGRFAEIFKKKIALIFPCIGNMINGGISFKPCIYYNYDNKCLFDGGGFAYWVAMIPN